MEMSSSVAAEMPMIASLSMLNMDRAFAVSSNPFIPGMIWSVSIKVISGCCFSTCNASLPLLAVKTLNHSNSHMFL